MPALFSALLYVAGVLHACPPLVVVVKDKDAKGHGAAVVVDPRGYAVTCLHCVGRRDKVIVVFQDKSGLPATVVASLPEHDLALLRIEDGGRWRYPFLSLADALPRVTDQVRVWGHPHQFPFTLSTGTVTALGRRLEMPDGDPLNGLIQVDAAMNPGCSGGALLNHRGQLLGVPVAIREGAQGIGFAVPASAVRKLLEKLPR